MRQAVKFRTVRAESQIESRAPNAVDVIGAAEGEDDRRRQHSSVVSVAQRRIARACELTRARRAVEVQVLCESRRTTVTELSRTDDMRVSWTAGDLHDHRIPYAHQSVRARDVLR